MSLSFSIIVVKYYSYFPSTKVMSLLFFIIAAIALFVSFLINLFVVAVFASAFSSPDEASKASLRLAVSKQYQYSNPFMHSSIVWKFH